jgi:hypothetical protein
MKIDGSISQNSTYGLTGSVTAGNNTGDSQLKSLQDQMDQTQDELKKLSSNQTLSMEEKAEKRKELQQKIQDLYQQIMQRKIEIQREKMQNSKDENQENQQEQQPVDGIVQQRPGVISTISMEGLITAANNMKQIHTVASTQNSLKESASVLTQEIKIDQGRKTSVAYKEKQLRAVQSRIDKAGQSIMEQISDTNKAITKENDIEQNDEQDKDNAIDKEKDKEKEIKKEKELEKEKEENKEAQE